jgi:hypothetical protein
MSWIRASQNTVEISLPDLANKINIINLFLSPMYTYTFDFQKRPSHIGKCHPIYVLKPYQNISRGRILGRNWDKSLKSFPPCNSQSPLLTDFTPPSPLSKQRPNSWK